MLKGKVPEALYDQMNRKFTDDIERIEARLAEAEAERVTSEELLEFSKSMLADIAEAWQAADVEQKQRVQSVLFPSGLLYHPEKGILNFCKDSLFNQLEEFVSGRISLARPERFELPT